ncbi:hypothetical protein [Streptomyces sp. bgisy091]|uniref:hypothetical protein n=1 Tax=Streptomyces sp. bgisy091 TaxID=3413778 RepID=UPI003D744A1D
MTLSTRKTPTKHRPFLEIRCGGVRLVVQRVPYGLITLVTTVSGVLTGGYWLPR